MFKNLRPLAPYLRKYRTTFWIGGVLRAVQQRRLDSLSRWSSAAPSMI